MVTIEFEKAVISPQEVREMLDIDNSEIIRLCKKASIIPRKNNKGQTYFSYEELQTLKKAQGKKTSQTALISQSESNIVVQNLISKLENIENNITGSLAKVIEEKLDGMDEVVVELIRCKTENETLRQKINELSRENYQLKNKVKSYKSVGLGLYMKKAEEDFSL